MVKGSTPVRRGDVYWVNLDPTVGTGIKKTRPGLVVPPLLVKAWRGKRP